MYDEPGPWVEAAPFDFAKEASEAPMPDSETCTKIRATAQRYPRLQKRPARLAQLAEVTATPAQVNKVLGTYSQER